MMLRRDDDDVEGEESALVLDRMAAATMRGRKNNCITTESCHCESGRSSLSQKVKRFSLRANKFSIFHAPKLHQLLPHFVDSSTILSITCSRSQQTSVAIVYLKQ